MKLIKEQLKVTQEQYAQMSKHIISLQTQLTSKPAVKSDPETTSLKREIALKKDDAQKKDTSLKEDTLKDTDEDGVDL